MNKPKLKLILGRGPLIPPNVRGRTRSRADLLARAPRPKAECFFCLGRLEPNQETGTRCIECGAVP